ncbi:MAG: hypothetical protein ACXU86_01815 [Archangium sp.]
MKSPQVLLTVAVLMSSLAYAAAPASYQVTGEVVDVKEDKLTVMKGKEKFEITRPADLQATGGELKPGAKVTVEYTMTAKSITVKGGAKEAAKPAPKK